MAEELKTNNMPGKSKMGGGLEVGSAYKMKNSMLKMSAKNKSPMQANYGSPMKDYSIEKGSHDHPHGASPTKHLGSATHPTGAIAAHKGHMSRKMTKNLKTKKD